MAWIGLGLTFRIEDMKARSVVFAGQEHLVTTDRNGGRDVEIARQLRLDTPKSPTIVQIPAAEAVDVIANNLTMPKGFHEDQRRIAWLAAC